MTKPISKKNYEVYFELYGKKMKATVMAENEAEAKKEVASKIIFHKVAIKKGDAFNTAIETMDGIIEALK